MKYLFALALVLTISACSQTSQMVEQAELTTQTTVITHPDEDFLDLYSQVVFPHAFQQDPSLKPFDYSKRFSGKIVDQCIAPESANAELIAVPIKRRISTYGLLKMAKKNKKQAQKCLHLFLNYGDYTLKPPQDYRFMKSASNTLESYLYQGFLQYLANNPELFKLLTSEDQKRVSSLIKANKHVVYVDLFYQLLYLHTYELLPSSRNIPHKKRVSTEITKICFTDGSSSFGFPDLMKKDKKGRKKAVECLNYAFEYGDARTKAIDYRFMRTFTLETYLYQHFIEQIYYTPELAKMLNKKNQARLKQLLHK